MAEGKQYYADLQTKLRKDVVSKQGIAHNKIPHLLQRHRFSHKGRLLQPAAKDLNTLDSRDLAPSDSFFFKQDLKKQLKGNGFDND